MRPPFVATCSLWESTKALSTYAYGARDRGHADAVEADRAKAFHHRSAFVRFRQNHLAHLNRRFDGDFVLHRYYPRAHYDAASSTVEGHLYATEDHTVSLKNLGVHLDLRRGDSINVGFSAKFRRPEFVADVSALGFSLDEQWIDPVWQYGVFLFVRT